MLASDPRLVEVLERVEEAGRGEFRSPDGIDDREVGRDAFGNGVRQHLVQRRTGNLHDADPLRVAGGIPDHLRPWPFRRDHDPNLGLIRPSAQPVRIHE